MVSGLGGITKYFSVAVNLMSLDLSARMILQVPNLDNRVKSIASIGIALARFPIMKKLTKGLPFGIGGILTSLMTLSAIQTVFTALPTLIAGFTQESDTNLLTP